jgi:hypothetical protein
METTLKLRRAIWNKELRRSIMNKQLTKSGAQLEDRLHSNIDESTPAGRLYSRGSLTGRKTSGTKGFKAKQGTTTRVIVAARIFRASSPGQPPAKRSNRLYNSIHVRRVPGKLEILASVNAPGVEVLDNPGKLNRPFFRSVIRKYRHEEFVNNAKEGIREMLT